MAINSIATRGYDATTLREIAAEAGVSVGLLYRYFPSKRAVVMALYEQLSADFASGTATLAPGRWRERFLAALACSLQVLHPHRTALRALTPMLVGHPEDGIFSEATAFSRTRVQAVFERAVEQASDAPRGAFATSLGRLLYLVHLAVLLWWILDRTPQQRATTALVAAIEQVLPAVSLALRLPVTRRFVTAVDALVQEALFPATSPA